MIPSTNTSFILTLTSGNDVTVTVLMVTALMVTVLVINVLVVTV